jgi:hypothetical protein
MTDYYAPTYPAAIRRYVSQFGAYVRWIYWSLLDPVDDSPPRPKPVAAVQSVWGAFRRMLYRDHLEELFRPKKAERRKDWNNLGWEDPATLSADERAYNAALIAEFGGA